MLRESLELSEARELVLGRVFDEREFGPLATRHLRAAFETMDSGELASVLVGGMTKREYLALHPEPLSVRFHVMEQDDFLLHPLPNHLFTRDTSAWIYDGVSINAMRWPA
ncbi:arginine deiminase, partial [Streptomyces sp. NRRL WC-3753]